MKKKIFIALSIYSLIFLLGGIYIIATFENSTATLYHLIELYQVETLRERLLIRVKDVQSDLSLRKTSYSKSADNIIANVRSLENMSRECFGCHHTAYVVEELKDLENRIEKYKVLISRTLTIRANRERLEVEDNNAFNAAEQLSRKINRLVHEAAGKLSDKTQSSLKDISNTKMILYLLVGITPFFAAGLGFFFIRDLTKPIKILLKATRTLEEGNLEYRIEGLRDEFGEVAASFNKMAARVEESTQSFKRQTIRLERAHHEMSTFCQVLKQIGVQRTLDGVRSFLMKELQKIVENKSMLLYFFSSDRSCLFALSDRETSTIENPDLIRIASSILKGLDGITIAPKEPFKPPLIPDYFPAKGLQIIIPLQNQNHVEGAFVVAYEQNCPCNENALELVALVLGQVLGTLRRAVLQEEEVRNIRNRIDSTSEFCGIIGKNPKMQVIYKLIQDIAPSDVTVLIEGESGTGKELLAHAIHRQSLRKDKPFVVINCSAYPPTLLESEIFGHEKGAFTGSIRQKAGRFEQADGGTVFLDEIGEIPPSAQVKLLRILQTQKFERLGGENTLSVNVRILAATNKDLLKEVENGNFREDLYYRLKVIPIVIPPLRDRRHDILLIIQQFLNRFTKENNKKIQGISPEVTRLLINHSWPGNVRELENTIEHAVLLCKGERIEVSELPVVLENSQSIAKVNGTATLFNNERKLLNDVLEEVNWNKTRAALCLGISRSSLYAKIKKYKINKPLRQ